MSVLSMSSSSSSSVYLKSGSDWRSSRNSFRVTMLLLLASYLLIFTVVTSFVTSQPVTNPTPRNKLRAAIMRESSSLENNAADVRSSQQEKEGQLLLHLSPLILLPPNSTPRLNQLRGITQQLEMERVTSEAKVEVERIPPVSKETPSQESVNNPNAHDDDPFLMTMRSKNMENEEKTATSPVPNSSSFLHFKGKIKEENEIGGEVGGKLGKEMARDKNKVMVTDDVKMSSGGNPNPSFSTQNADQLKMKEPGNLWHTPSHFHEDGEDDFDEGNSNSNNDRVEISQKVTITSTTSSTKIHIPIESNNNKVNNTAGNLNNKSHRIMSTAPQSMTAPNILQEGHRNANGINNHANLLQESPERVAENEKKQSTSKSHTTNKTNSGNNPVTSREHDDEEVDVDANGNDNDNNAESADEQEGNGDEKFFDRRSRGNTESRLVTTKMDNVSLSYLSSLQSSLFSPVDKNKGDKGQEGRGRESDGEHQSDYYYDSASTDNDDGDGGTNPLLSHHPSPVSSPLLMNKWIKSLVKLSQCRANCLDHHQQPAGDGGFSVDSLSACQESCKRKFPLAKRPNLAPATDGKSINGTSRRSNEYAIRSKKHTIPNESQSQPSSSSSSSSTRTTGNNSNGNNSSSNNNIQREEPPVEMEKADRKSNNNRHQQHHYIPSQKGLVEQHHDENQLSSNLPRRWEHTQQQLSKTAEEKPIQQQQQLPNGQNKVEEETKRNESSNNSLMKLLAIEQASKDTGSPTNFKTFPSEPRLKVGQVVGRKSGEDGIPLHFLQLSWPKPLGGRTVGNNNNRPEGESAQVKDKKGIDQDDVDDDDDDKDEKNEKQPRSQRPGGDGIQPTTMYSIILEQSWESKLKPDGTRDTYARWWKLIDQTVERTTTQILLPIILPTEQKGPGGKEKSEQVTAGAFGQKKEIKEKAMRKNSQRMRMMMMPSSLSSSSFSATDPPSKVTLWVLAVTSEGGLEKVYFAELNNSYYHFYLNEHHHDQQEHPNPSTTILLHHHQHQQQQVYRENHKGILAVKDVDRSGSIDNPPASLNFSNEKTGNQSVVVSGLDKKKEKVKKKVENKKSEARIGVDWDGNNENSNQILAFPSKDTSFGRGRGSISSEKVKKLLKLGSSIQQNYKSKGGNDASAYKTGHDVDDNDVDNDEQNTFTFSHGKSMSLSSSSESENVQNWGLHTVSMVYQKFLVVTQVTWDYPGDTDFSQEEETLNKLVGARDAHDDDGSRKIFKRNTENDDKTIRQTNNASSFTVTLRNNSRIVHDSHETQSETRRREMDHDARSGGGGGGGSNNQRQKRCGSSHKNGKGGENGKLNFLLSWEIFGGGLRGNLVTDTCSASISLWPDTVYIIQVGLITSTENVSKSSGSEPDSSFQQQSQSRLLSSSAMSNSAPSESKKDATHPETHSSVDDRDIDNDEMSNRGRKLERDIDESLSFSKATLPSSSTISVEENGSGEQEERNNLVGNDVSKASLDPLILPESITFPFDGGEPKVTIKSERILVNTTRASATLQDKISLGNTQSNNNFHKGKTQRPKPLGKNSDSNTDQVLVSPITIKKNGDGQNEHFSPVNGQPTLGTTLGTVDEDGNSVWDDDDDEATDQDESLFARYHSHHHLHNQHHPNQVLSKVPPISLAEGRSSQPEAEFDPQPHQKNTKGSMKTASLSLLSPSGNGIRYPNFFPVNSFYQSLYALSQNALQVSSRYPSVITINGGLSNKSSSSNDNLAPLILSEFGNSNHSGYLYGNSGESGSAVGGKLYTLFVILVISFVIFLFIVAIVGFCVLTSSIKENYKYFVPKKVRVWTTVGQLLKGSHNQSSSSASSSPFVGGRNSSNSKDTGVGSFYPRRLHEDPDYEFDDNDDYDPDEDDEEEVTSVADTDEEDCDCNSDDGRGGPRNTFSLNERSSSILLCSPLIPLPPDTSNLIRIGETEEIRVTLEAPPQHQESGAGESGGGSCDNNNPYYHSMPGNSMLTVGSSSSSSSTNPQTHASTAAAVASFQENFYLTPSSSPPHHHHHQQQHSPNNHPRKKTDVRIDVSSNSNPRKAPSSHQRHQGYY